MIADAPPRPPNTDPILRHVHSLPYFKLRVFLAKKLVGEEKYPRFLYKYKAPVESVTLPYLRDLVVEGRLFLSSPTQFNDPFDMTAAVVFDGTEKEKKDRIRRLIADRSQGMNRKQRRELEAEILGSGESEIIRKVTAAHQQNAEGTGVFSFAGDPRSILMWSHYGKDHAGVCFQFECARDPNVFLWAVRMEYVDAYPSFNFASGSSGEIQSTLTHKFKKWSYEDESRLVWPRGARTYARFEPSALTGVILGCRVTQSTKTAVLDLLRERRARGLREVKVFAAVKHPSRYALCLKRLPSA